MSLRLRLTLLYTGVLSGVVLLLSIVIYSMVSVVMVNQIDGRLQQAADHIIEALRADTIGTVDFSPGSLNISNTIYYQVWSRDNQLLIYSENTRDFTDAIDPYAKDLGRTMFREVTKNQVVYRVLTVPLTVNGDPSGVLQMGLTLTELRYTQQILQIVFGISAVFSIIVAGVVGWLVTGQALEPLETMTQVATQITSTDDLSQRIPVEPGRNDEVGKMILTFNQTLVRLERLFSAQRRFLADVSHELRTPLTVIKGNVGLMRLTKSFDAESLESIESEVDRLTRLVGDLLLLAQAETGKLPLMMTPVEVDSLLMEVYDQMKVLAAEKSQGIDLENIEPAVVVGDRDRLKQVLINLGSNAIKYTPEDRRIALGLYQQGNWVEIVVRDEGPGIPKKDQAHLFERFFRGDKSRNRSEKEGGFGLGLSIAYWIVRNHGGRIEVESRIGQGTTFSVWLPISQSEVPTRPLKPTRLQENRSRDI
jgi:heavy metal sensor kinase